MSSCQSNVQPVPSQPLPQIHVNGVLIGESVLANELQYHQHADFNKVVQQAGQALVIKQLLWQAALQQDIAINDTNEETALQLLMEKVVTYDDPSEQDCARYFSNNPTKFSSMPLMEVEHILLAAAKDDIPAREVAKNLSKKIIEQLKQDPVLFPALAKQYSVCPSKQDGGSLGQISKGQTVAEFERQLMNLPTGLAHKPIESRYGFHVVHVSRKVAGKPLEYAMVADKVRAYLIHRASHLAIQRYIQQLIERAEISGITLQFDDHNIQNSGAD